ncbi:uncharacterized protein LOC129044688 [Pongo pygmaeus]|uniref:uncharacterized protein LOC129044688 n=1 Tax=Pongo pygmaeus TaxID=9600 RepID=UPI0023E2D15B|nr:uncharacterized protein LOC129044688 [Pongo pygmaeus]
MLKAFLSLDAIETSCGPERPHSLCPGKRKTETAVGGGINACVWAPGPASSHLWPGIVSQRGTKQSLFIRPVVGSGPQKSLSPSSFNSWRRGREDDKKWAFLKLCTQNVIAGGFVGVQPELCWTEAEGGLQTGEGTAHIHPALSAASSVGTRAPRLQALEEDFLLWICGSWSPGCWPLATALSPESCLSHLQLRPLQASCAGIRVEAPALCSSFLEGTPSGAKRGPPLILSHSLQQQLCEAGFVTLFCRRQN